MLPEQPAFLWPYAIVEIPSAAIHLFVHMQAVDMMTLTAKHVHAMMEHLHPKEGLLVLVV